MSTDNNITIRILEREFKVKCPADKIADLHESARLLDGKIREICNEDKIVNMDRLAIIAALNITHDLINQKKQNNLYIDALSSQIKSLQNKIEEALTTA